MRLTPLLLTSLVPLVLFACENSDGPSPAPSGRPDGGPPTGLSPGGGPGPSDPRCPSFPPEQSAPCKGAALRCEWNSEVLGTTVALCDGQFWRLAARDRDCPSMPPAGRCGSYNGACGYLVAGAYPSSSGTGTDTCTTSCFCRDGLWECDSTCKCPRKPTDDPSRFVSSEELKGACLHPTMQCNYSYRIGQDEPDRGTTGQPCQTSFTCSAEGRWQRVDMCTCPMFTPGQRGYIFECRSEGLRCQFPGVEEGDPSRTCTCQGGSWSCPR
jgi:hypothetical protein